MKITLGSIVLMTALSTASFAADFSGKLIDATCHDQKQQGKAEACDATTATTAFAIDMNGKTYKLDAAGNTKATEALKGRADRSADPAKALTATYSAKVTGTEKDGMIAVESIEIQ